jgi:hypothetical protein
MNLYQPTITGSLSVSGSVNISGSITIAGGGTISGTASYATNAELLDGLDSTAFTLTSSFAAQTASFTAFTASILAQTASLNTFSASVLSYTSSLNAKTSSFATTGSNTFEGIQTVNSNLIVTGSITAQTLVVQTITSSVDFVTGSTRFGSIAANTHVFTGSVLITGSIGINKLSLASNVFLHAYSTTNTQINVETAGGGESYSQYTLKSGTGDGAAFFLNNASRSGEAGGNMATIRNDVGSLRLQSAGGAVSASLGITILSGSGYVGIGTTTPSYLLDVRSSASSGAPIVGNFQSAGGDAQLYVSNGSVTTQLTADNTNSISIVGSYTNHPLVIRTNNAERMRITTAGNIGIGTNSPTAIGGYNAITLSGTDGSFVDFRYNNSGYGRVFASATTALGMESLSTTLPLVFKTQNGGGSIERMRITPNGEVGIGVTPTSGNIFWIKGSSSSGSDTAVFVQNSTPSTLFSIRNDGIVSKPLQPAFNAGKNTNSSVSAGATVVFQLTTGDKFNVGGHYNASTGIFTAPVAGIYDFSASIIWMNVPNGTAMDDSFWIYKNSNIVAYGLRRAEYESTYTGNGGYYVDFANVLLSLAVGDTVKVVNNRALEIHGNTAYSYFQGYMLG